MLQGLIASVLVLACSVANAAAADFAQDLMTLTRERDAAQYETPDGDSRVKAFEAVQQHAAALTKQYPTRSEPLVHEAWALIDQASVLRNFSSLGLLKQARKKLEAALTLDPNNAAAYSTLGSLYFNVPGFPLSFGAKAKGRVYLKKALSLDPNSDWQNLDYAKALFKDEDYPNVIKHATITARSPVRPNDKRSTSLRTEAEALIAKAKEQLR